MMAPARLSLPKLPPPTPELRRLRREGVHVHAVRFDTATAEQERQATVAGLARLGSKRAMMWYWRACTLDDWCEGNQEWNEAALRHELDRAGEFSRWTDFEREAIQRPLEELHGVADFRIHHRVHRRAKVVSVHFWLEKPESGGGAGSAP